MEQVNTCNVNANTEGTDNIMYRGGLNHLWRRGLRLPSDGRDGTHHFVMIVLIVASSSPVKLRAKTCLHTVLRELQSA